MSGTEPKPLSANIIAEGSEKSPALQKLELLEASGKYLFHGSPTANIMEFEPRQARTGNPKTGVDWDDGPPGVAAADVVGPAIFKAIISRPNLGEGVSMWSSFGRNQEGKVEYSANKKGLEVIKSKGAIGYVYVFDRNGFHPFRGFEYRSEDPVRPIDVVTVGFEDLPEYIEIVEDK